MQPAKQTGEDGFKFERFTPPSTEELDALIPGYKFLEFIDCGGMGAVYKAVQKSLNRTVAVKLLPQVHRHKATFSDRFKREAHALAQLNHPHIVAVHDFGETKDGQMFYAMEFVSGMDLQQLLKRAPPGPKQILKIVTQVCEALQYAHERGIVHRDIKPANILIDERGNVKVADFGLVKMVGPEIEGYTATGSTLGTPDYIAPEALDQGGKIDHRADIYSLGVMIYELLTGHVPKGMWEPPSIRSGADKRIDVVVSRAMQNDPDKRYQHVSDMTQVLEKLLINSENWKNYRRPAKSGIHEAGGNWGGVPSGAVTQKIQPEKAHGRSPLAWSVGAALLLGIGFAGVWQAGWLTNSADEGSKESAQSGLSADPAPVPPASEQLKLAEWVFAHDGFVNVQAAGSTVRQMGESADIWSASELPKGPFAIWRVSLTAVPIKEEADLQELTSLAHDAGSVSNLCLRGLDVPVDALAHLAAVPTLNNLDITSSPMVTDNVAEYLAACQSLTLLRISSSRLPTGSTLIEKLGFLKPDCKVSTTE